jgi:hypothetical protein
MLDACSLPFPSSVSDFPNQRSETEGIPMGFNYTREKRRFDAEWRKRAEQYGNAGMDAGSIQAMRDYDWVQFCRRRTYENSVQSLPSEAIDNAPY